MRLRKRRWRARQRRLFRNTGGCIHLCGKIRCSCTITGRGGAGGVLAEIERHGRAVAFG